MAYNNCGNSHCGNCCNSCGPTYTAITTDDAILGKCARCVLEKLCDCASDAEVGASIRECYNRNI